MNHGDMQLLEFDDSEIRLLAKNGTKHLFSSHPVSADFGCRIGGVSKPGSDDENLRNEGEKRQGNSRKKTHQLSNSERRNSQSTGSQRKPFHQHSDSDKEVHLVSKQCYSSYSTKIFVLFTIPKESDGEIDSNINFSQQPAGKHAVYSSPQVLSDDPSSPPLKKHRSMSSSHRRVVERAYMDVEAQPTRGSVSQTESEGPNSPMLDFIEEDVRYDSDEQVNMV